MDACSPSLASPAVSPAEQRQLADLRRRDQQVRAHEAAHSAAGGSLTGAVSYTFQKGPDGQSYAVGGEVSIDTSAVDGDPQATIAKAQQIVRAALAPADPSGQDRAVAAQAAQLAVQARMELATKTETTGQENSNQPNADQRTSKAIAAYRAADGGSGPAVFSVAA
ncbi:hypothetical protein LBMAG53_22990 [Planctomycetota bacterium]|nr:hypothetical protein LBMAG53_22990 [Planctomycetota bacterium]